MDDEEKGFYIKLNLDKAKNKIGIAIILIIINILTYIPPLIAGEFDFGFIFEIISLIFLMLVINNIEKVNIDKSKRYISFAMIPVGWLLIYDIITIMVNIDSVLNIANGLIFSEALSVAYISTLYMIKKDIENADNPEKYKEKADTFYEKK